MAADNDFGRMIENTFMVANSNLILERKPEYLVHDVHHQNGYFAYVDEHPTSPKKSD